MTRIYFGIDTESQCTTLLRDVIFRENNYWILLKNTQMIHDEILRKMEECVYNAMKNKAGKWVRYDQNGKMLKGLVTIVGDLAKVYPNQRGNTYYYDKQTGLMAKGYVTLEGVPYHFDETTGELIR